MPSFLHVWDRGTIRKLQKKEEYNIMKYQKHYLSDDKSPKYCPMSQNEQTIQCDSFCAWFDHEAQDCRLMLYIGDLSRVFNNDKREFKF